MRRPNLPNPGNERSWKISEDEDNDFVLELLSADGAVVDSDVLYRNISIDAGSFEKLAMAILNRIEMRETFVGTYTY